MLRLREMSLENLPVFKKWMHAPHIAPWYAVAADWIDEVERQNGDKPHCA